MNKLFFILLAFSLFFTKANSQKLDIQKKADYFLKLLQEHYRNGDYNLHKDYSDSLLLISKKHKLTKTHILALVNQGVFYKNRSEPHKSIELYHTALKKCELIPHDFRTKTIVLVNMGNTYFNIGAYKKAIVFMEEVLKIADTTKGSMNIKSAALIGLANNYAELKTYDKVLEYNFKVKALGEQTKNENAVVTAMNNISDTYNILEKYEEAIIYGEQALALPYLEKPTKKRALALLNLGISHFKSSHLDKAIAYLTKAKQIAVAKKIVSIEIDCCKLLAEVYEQKGDFKKSYAEQKRYTEIRSLQLENSNEATKLDLNKNIEAKEEELINSSKTISALGKKRTQIIILASLIGILLCALLIFFVKRKKSIEKEQEKLRAQYIVLKQSIRDIEKEKTNKVSSNLKNLKENETSSYKNSSLTVEDRNSYKNKIIAYMNKEKPYLDYNLNQAQLASKLEISTHHFSEILHFSFEQNFYNFINSYRILEVQKLITNPKYQDSKILAIAFESGFKSKTSFNRIFKKHTGMTPSEYRQKMT